MNRIPSRSGSLKLCFLFTIDAAVDLLDGVRQLELVDDFTLHGGDAAGVLALDDINYLKRKLGVILAYVHAVLDDIDREVVVDIAKHREIRNDLGVYLDDILLAHSATLRVLDDSHGAVELVKSEELVYLHRLTCFDVVDNDSVLYLVYVHFAASSKSILISAIRMYLP